MPIFKRIPGQGERPVNAKLSLPFLFSAGFLIVWVVFGGNMPTNPLLFGLLAMSGTVLLVVAILQGAGASWASLTWPARLALLFFCGLPLLQLIPLPPALWQSLPGRALPTEILMQVEMAQAWRPLTLSVEPTVRSALIFLWLAAFLLLLLRLSSDELRRLFTVLLWLGFLNVVVGIVQVVSGNTTLKLYDGLNSPFLNGLFANKNHTGLFIVMTFLAGYASLYAAEGWNRQRLVVVVPVSLLLFVSLIATFSRAGLMFGVLAIGFLALLSVNPHRDKGRLLWAGGIVLLGIAAVAIIGSTGLAARAFARFGGVSEDLRWLIWQWSWPLVGTYFPFGSGIGTFTAVFPPHEQLAWVKPTFVNHAHNDYLEQLIEVGAAAPLGWVLALAAVLGPTGLAWRTRRTQRGRLALIGAAMLFLIAAHSVVDYPLRRPAIAATCMVALAAVLRMGDRKSRLRSNAVYARREP